MATKPIKKKSKAVKAKATPKSKVKKAVKKPVKQVAKKSASKAKPVKPASKVNKSKKVVAAKSSKPAKKTVKPVKAAKPVAKKPVKAKAPKVVKPAVKKAPIAKPVVKQEKPKVVVKPEVKKVAPPVIKKAAAPVIKKPVIKKIEPVDNRTRYSDEELREFRELIVGKLETARGELKYLQEQISRSSEMGDDSDARFKGLEDGTSTSEREYLSQMASRQIQYIGHLEKALIRIENKTYGICRETGRLISKERLRAVPHATLSIEAKQGGKG